MIDLKFYMRKFHSNKMRIPELTLAVSKLGGGGGGGGRGVGGGGTKLYYIKK